MKTVIPPFHQRSLAMGEDSRLTSHISQPPDDFSIAIQKSVQRIRDLNLLAELLDQFLRSPQIVARDARVEVMDGLELQATVKEVEPFGAIDVHGCPQHFLWEGLVCAEIGSAHGEMAQGDLDVKGRGDHVADHDEQNSSAYGGDGFVDDAIAEPCPEKELAGKLEPAMPPGGSLLRSQTQEEIFPTQPIEVEATEG